MEDKYYIHPIYQEDSVAGIILDFCCKIILMNRQSRAISFPEAGDVISIRQNSTLMLLNYLVKLLYGAGTFTTVLYVFSVVFLRPLFEKQLVSRRQVFGLTLEKLASLRNSLISRVKIIPANTNSVLKDGVRYVDQEIQASTQKDKDTSSHFNGKKKVKFEDDEPLEDKLGKLTKKLDQLADNIDPPDQDLYGYYGKRGGSEVEPLKLVIRETQALLDSYLYFDYFKPPTKTKNSTAKKEGKTGNGKLCLVYISYESKRDYVF